MKKEIIQLPPFATLLSDDADVVEGENEIKIKGFILSQIEIDCEIDVEVKPRLEGFTVIVPQQDIGDKKKKKSTEKIKLKYRCIVI